MSQGLMFRRQIVGQYVFVLLRNLRILKFRNLIIYGLQRTLRTGSELTCEACFLRACLSF